MLIVGQKLTTTMSSSWPWDDAYYYLYGMCIKSKGHSHVQEAHTFFNLYFAIQINASEAYTITS